ncbi:MAG: undecaprenyl-diphosphate phosphatase [Defluviitaleaceae bacterium]|nr:undecaprenyl-diphosphate phosphatase [Defluviitaleaceae bacterium]
MNLIQAIILGIIQGLSEFLPISSSGHLMLFHEILGIEAQDNMTFIIVLNMGSLLPLLFVFRKDVAALIKKPFQKTTALLAIATVPLVIATLIFEGFIESTFISIEFLPFGFVITGAALLLSDKIRKNKKEFEKIGFLDAIFVGLVQALAVIPGISRSGATITASMSRGINREAAAKFSFLMSIPAALGAMIFRTSRIIANPALLDGIIISNLVAGFIAAAITGYFAINFMLNLVKKARLKYFALYYIFAVVVIIFVFLI